jgi:uncharacterized protein YggE
MDQEKNMKSLFADSYVRKATGFVFSILAIFLLGKAVNEFNKISYTGSEPLPASTIIVSGEGEVVSVPDIATFSFSVTEESPVVATAQDESAKTTNAIIDFLTKNGVEKKDIKTSGYNIYPRYEYEGGTYYQTGKRQLAAYVVSQSVEVKVRKLSDAGKLLGGLGELGATDVSSLTFGFDKEESLRVKARKDAIAAAKEKAQITARDLGVKLGKVVSYNENYDSPMFYGRGGALAMDAGKVSTPEITPGESKIKSSVSITYEIK